MDDWFTSRGIHRTEGVCMLLDIPDTRQRSDFDCGAAAVDAVCRFHRIRRGGELDLVNPIQGLGPDTAAAILRAYGLSVLAGPMTVEDLQHFTRTNRPVLCPVNLFGGHWTVCRGVERGGVHFHCPLQGRVRMPVTRWLEEWVSHSESGHAYERWGIATSR